MESKYQTLIEQEIKSDHFIGTETGGSGHKAHVSFSITDIKTEQQNSITKITYQYAIGRESEFTVYTEDTEPNEDIYKKTIYVKDNTIIKKEKKKCIKSSFNPEERDNL